jgi:hypothetical protein
MTILFVLLFALAVHRVTHFITRDKLELVAVPRERFVQRWGVYSDATDKTVSISGRKTNAFMRSLAYLCECDWCASIWVGTVGAVVLGLFFPLPLLCWLLSVLAASSVTALLADVEDRLNRE